MKIVRKKKNKDARRLNTTEKVRRVPSVDENSLEGKRKREILKKKKRIRMRRRLIVFLFLTVCIAVIVAVLKAPLFNIESVYCIGQQNMTEKQILKIANVQTGVNIFTTNIKSIEKRLVDNPEISEATVKRVFPDKIKIMVKEAVPVIYIKHEKNLLLVDRSGKIIKVLSGDAAKNPPEIIRVYGIEPLEKKAGGYIDAEGDVRCEELFRCIGYLDDAEMLEKVNAINVGDLSDVQLEYEKRLYILLGGCEKMEYKLKFIEKVISEKISDYERALLDYRGDKLYVGPREDDKKAKEEAENAGASDEKDKNNPKNTGENGEKTSVDSASESQNDGKTEEKASAEAESKQEKNEE